MNSSVANRSLRAGLFYFLIVFAIAFVLGATRVIVVVPRIGEVAAVLIEVPILLTLAWFICGWLMQKSQVPRLLWPRIVVSATAFVLLLSTEFAMANWLFGNPPGAYLRSFATLHGAIGFAGQVAFAFFPVVQSRSSD